MSGPRFIWVVVLCIVLVRNSEALNYSKTSGLSPAPWKNMVITDKEVHERLEQLHAVIDALQNKVLDERKGREQSNRASVDILKARYERLSTVLSKMSGQNAKLQGENKVLKQSNGALVDKISALEARLHQIAKKETDTGVEAWLLQTALELRRFLEVNGLEHFSSPKLSPIVAGLVSNGVILLPVTMSSLFLLTYGKHLTVLRVLMATNLFEVGVAIAIIISSVLLLGDPLEGMRHISEANFVFVQIVLVSVFWIAILLLIVSISQTWQSRAWRYCVGEIVLKCVSALIYMWQVWVPTMKRNNTPIKLPLVYYAMFVMCSFGCMALTAWANRSWMFCKSQLQGDFHPEKNWTWSIRKLEQDSRSLPFHHTD